MRRSLYYETFLIALAVLVLEVSYTRVFSFKLVYYFTYVIIGVALLGLGAGGVIVSASERVRRIPTEKLILTCCVVAGLSVLLGYLLIALTPLRLFSMVLTGWGRPAFVAGELLKVFLVLSTLLVPFLAGGIALAAIFSRGADRIGRLYAADLFGAALGCILVIPAMTLLSPPGVVYAACAAFVLAGLGVARESGAVAKYASFALTALLAVGALGASHLPDPVRDPVKGKESNPIFSAWDPVFRVDVVPVPGTDPEVRFLVHDGTIGSSLIEFDGDVGSLARYDDSDRAYPFRVLPPSPRVAIVGAAGGNEVMASLRLGAEHVTGIELNPVTVSLLREHFLDFTGRLAEHPRVTIVNSEGRSYLRGAGQTFDLIWLVAPDSYAAMNAATSGAFVLSESYLYTQEMIEEALDNLTPDGVLCAQFGEIDFDVKPNRVLRYLGTARQAFLEQGVGDFQRHALVSVAPGFGRLNSSTILLKKSPFTRQQIEDFRQAVSRVDGGEVIYLGPEDSPASLLRQVIELEGDALERFYRSYPYEVSPITDDAPFFWHFVRFADLLGGHEGPSGFNVEEGTGERVLIALLLISLLFAATFLSVPLFALREAWTTVPNRAAIALYFASLGLGFMFIEVAMIQKLTLLLGYPTYSLTVTLFAILLSTGVGSLLTERWTSSTPRVLGRIFAVLVVLVGFNEIALAGIIDSVVGLPLSVRVAVAVVVLFPLGCCLGMFMPIGLRTVASFGDHGEQVVAWCWAVNGFFSVAGSILATMLSMGIGFGGVMLCGLAVYAIGLASLTRAIAGRRIAAGA